MKISLIVPIYNEEQAIPVFYNQARGKLSSLGCEVEILFIDDGSTDKSLTIIEDLAASDQLVVYISFSKNFGKEAALMAGLQHAAGEAVIPVDVDLQDPLEIILRMVAIWRQGAQVVAAKRRSRADDSWAKRCSARCFYWLHNKIADDPLEKDVGDFRLLDRQVVEALKLLPERELFMKGLFSWVGFQQVIVEYDRPARAVGASKFSGWKLWNFALSGITSFSTLPLRIWTYAGLAIALCSFMYASVMILGKLIWDNPVPGFPSLLVSILFLGGVQLIGIGVMGEYLGRIYAETKRRPRYIIKSAKMNHPPVQDAGRGEDSIQ